MQHLHAAAEGGDRGSEHLRVGDRGDRDRVGCGAGRAGGAEAEVLAVVAGGDHREDACGGDVVDHGDQHVVQRFRLRAAAGEVDDVHPVRDRRLERLRDLRRLGDVTDRRRHVEDAVVAEVRLRRDAREAAGRGMVGARGCARVRVAGGDARDVRSVERRLAVERQLAAGLGLRAGAREVARDDHLVVRERRVADREAGRRRTPSPFAPVV